MELTKVWWLLAAVLVVAAGWIGYDSWRDTNAEADRQTDRLTCAMVSGDEDC